MNRGRFGRKLCVGLLATCASVFNVGCIDRVLENAVVGFGFSLGALPAQVVADFIFGSFLTPDDGTDGA